MHHFWAGLVVVVFAALLHLFKLLNHAKNVGTVAAKALGILRDAELDEDTKARAMRRHSLKLFGLFGVLAVGSGSALVIPLGGIWFLDRAGAASLEEVLAVLEDPLFLLGTLLVGSAAYGAYRAASRR